MQTDAMIAFLPSNESWCQQEFPHMTLVWGGPIDGNLPGDFNQLSKDAISAARITGPFSLNVTGVQELGGGDSGNPAVDALIFYPTPKLLLARNLVKRWDASSFSDFLPHATIGSAGSATSSDLWTKSVMGNSMRSGFPVNLWFDRIAACWGEQKLIFDISNL